MRLHRSTWTMGAMLAGAAAAIVAGCRSKGGITPAETAPPPTGSFAPRTDITPMEEYEYGRAACAMMVADPKAPLVRNEALTRYVAEVGNTLALVCERPDLYNGWHFAVVRSRQINAFSTPGGFIVVTTGCIAACRSEDELASVLAHEVAHIELGHPTEALEQAMRKAGHGSQTANLDLAPAVPADAEAPATARDPADALDVAAPVVPAGFIFEHKDALKHALEKAEAEAKLKAALRKEKAAVRAAVWHVAYTHVGGHVPTGEHLLKVLQNLAQARKNGYDRRQEDAADRRAVTLLARAGYNPHAMAALLDRMQARKGPEPLGDHFRPEHRAALVRQAVAAAEERGATFADSPARDDRFRRQTAFVHATGPKP